MNRQSVCAAAASASAASAGAAASASSSLMEQRKRRDRKLAAAAAAASKKNIPADAKSRFGRKFQLKLCELAMSDDDPNALEQLQAMHDEALAYYEEHNLTEMWLSDDENDNSNNNTSNNNNNNNSNKQLKISIAKRMMRHDAKEQRSMTSSATSRTNNIAGSNTSSPSLTEEKESKLKTKTIPSTAAAAAAQLPSWTASSTIVSNSVFDLSEESEDDTTKRSGTARLKAFKLCDVCSDVSSTSTNALLECEDCGKVIHQKCNRPEISCAQARDPRFLFVCFICKDRDTKAERSGGGGGGPLNSGALVKPISSSLAAPIKKDDKTIGTQKQQTSDLSTAWATFAAKKKKPLNSSVSASSNAAIQSSTTIPPTTTKLFPSFTNKDRINK